jgi:hypothetical protein
MITWIILRGLFVPETRGREQPLRQYERRHAPFWIHLSTRARWIGVRVLLGLLVVALVSRISPATQVLWLGVLCVLASPLVLMFPALLYVLIPLAGTLAPVIARERQDANWETLRTLPISLPDLILQKAGGALEWMQDRLLNMFSMLIPVALSTGVLGVIFSLRESGRGGNGLDTADWLLALTGGGVCAAVLYADRMQQFVLMTVAALGVSASTRALHDTLPRALIVTGLAWLMDVVVALALLLHQDRLTWPVGMHLLILVLIGPVVAYLIELPVQIALLYALITLVAREIVIAAGWHSTLVAARNL